MLAKKEISVKLGEGSQTGEVLERERSRWPNIRCRRHGTRGMNFMRLGARVLSVKKLSAVRLNFVLVR